MPIFDYKCNNEKCNFTNEYIVGFSVVDEIPEKCPKCGIGNLEKQFSVKRISFDVIAGFDYIYGKKNWKQGKTAAQIAEHLVPGDDGKYKDPY
jgi:putative FmdB family regulatory protein